MGACPVVLKRLHSVRVGQHKASLCIENHTTGPCSTNLHADASTLCSSHARCCRSFCQQSYGTGGSKCVICAVCAARCAWQRVCCCPAACCLCICCTSQQGAAACFSAVCNLTWAECRVWWEMQVCHGQRSCQWQCNITGRFYSGIMTAS